MVMELEAIGAQLETVARDWSTGVRSRHDWPIKIVATKYRAVEGAWKIADRALEVSGGFGMFKKSEMERLFRDARAGRFHPANSSLSHEADRQAGARRSTRTSCRAGADGDKCRRQKAECRRREFAPAFCLLH